jgi:hypothetical protein
MDLNIVICFPFVNENLRTKLNLIYSYLLGVLAFRVFIVLILQKLARTFFHNPDMQALKCPIHGNIPPELECCWQCGEWCLLMNDNRGGLAR